MEKDFDRWHIFKKYLDKEAFPIDVRERDVWWCSVGLNIGSEQQSDTDNFSRPVVIVKRFTPDVFLGVPLTTKLKKDNFRARLHLEGFERDALVLHMRSYDRKRLIRKIDMLPYEEFKKITGMIISAVSPKSEIPLAGEISEAEANVGKL